ncbi:IS3 family transposase [Mucilaginibacter psychrotolerans]|uniref:IS3 family transposase n=1 Tax=Mucilaginibacter psychrotolerans TaxID=1524096 RepID=A0A4Y8RWW6_9SPHI|nr:IS3 family transposase [Mucilaginibacter psychrotolerans]TFF29714.1 IS3 family transposase [Mucilaginibacter psychrotolerans]
MTNVGHRKGRHITALCRLLHYSRQAFYQQRTVIEREALQDELIIQEVLRIRERQKRVGTRKLFEMLRLFLSHHKMQIGRDKLFDLLSAYGLLIRRHSRRAPRTTFSGHWMRKYPNLIVGVPILHPNKLWVSDITYITLQNDFAYLSLVTDAYSRMITGYYLSKDLRAEGCVEALKMALKQLPKEHNLIHHSDRGSQYCSVDYVEKLQSNNIAISMTQNSDPRENAIAERVNGIIKQEFLEECYADLSKARAGVKNAIYIYNHERLHSSIDMLTPSQAHTMSGKLKQHWKNYFQSNRETEVAMT